jgi:cephalosporin-C deacetylase
VLFDLPLPELERYRPEVTEPADFHQFWRRELADARSHPLDAVFDPAPTPVRHADVFDVAFAGYGGDRIKGWLFVPHELAPRPVMIVEYVGYGGGRGIPLDWLTFSCAGHPHLVMDTRGQGGGWRGSDTPDPRHEGAPGGVGFLMRGVLDARRQYYTRLYVDAVRAVDAALAHPVSLGLPVVTTGISQGGGLALAATHLADGAAATLPDVPFLSNFARAVQVTPAAPYKEIIDFCAVYPQHVTRVFESLSYLDIVNHARHIDQPALFSVGLLDEITPASTVYAAYNHYAGPKAIEVYPFNGHEGGGTRHLHAKLDYLDALAAGT